VDPAGLHLPLRELKKTVVQQFMTEFNAAVSEEYKIVANTKTVLNLMKQNDHKGS
jgi:hypothetical protein